jgi:predicted Fe-Mo cluster-binding NifX family protein
MGKGAINSLSSSGMEIIITDEKQSQDAVLKYVNGELRNLNKACDDSLK